MALIGTSTIVFPKLDANKDPAKSKRNHVCNVCGRAFKRSEHCIRHQRGRKSRAACFTDPVLPFFADCRQTPRRNHLAVEFVDGDIVAGIFNQAVMLL